MIGKEKVCSSWTRAAGTLFYTKRSRVSRIRVITDMATGDEKRTGEVPTLIVICVCLHPHINTQVVNC